MTRDLFDLVRSAVLSVVPSLDQAVSDAIMSKSPVDVSPLYKQVTGYIISDGPSDPLNLGPAGAPFPDIEMDFPYKGLQARGGQGGLDPEENISSVRPGAQVRDPRPRDLRPA